MLPGLSIMADVPGTDDRFVIFAEGARVALSEIKRREVCLVSPQPPDPVREAHPVDASNAARVEVVLQIPAFLLGIKADDREPVRRLRYWNLPALDQEALAG